MYMYNNVYAYVCIRIRIHGCPITCLIMFEQQGHSCKMIAFMLYIFAVMTK